MSYYPLTHRIRWLGTRLHSMNNIGRLTKADAKQWWWHARCDICGDITNDHEVTYLVHGSVGCYSIHWHLCESCMDKVNKVRDEFRAVLDYRKSLQHIELSLRHLVRRVCKGDFNDVITRQHRYMPPCDTCGVEDTREVRTTNYIYASKDPARSRESFVWTLCDNCADAYEELQGAVFAEEIRRQYHAQMRKFRQRVVLGKSLE